MLFSAPPSGSADYLAEIKQALSLWDGTGSFVFTSSAGVYTVEDGSGACRPFAAAAAAIVAFAWLASTRSSCMRGFCVVHLLRPQAAMRCHRY